MERQRNKSVTEGIEVIRLAAKGLTSRQTAEELGTSARTVESQRESIKRKLRVDSLTQAAVAFVLSTSGTTPPSK